MVYYTSIPHPNLGLDAILSPPSPPPNVTDNEFQAYAVLKDPARRGDYDENGHKDSDTAMSGEAAARAGRATAAAQSTTAAAAAAAAVAAASGASNGNSQAPGGWGGAPWQEAPYGGNGPGPGWVNIFLLNFLSLLLAIYLHF